MIAAKVAQVGLAAKVGPRLKLGEAWGEAAGELRDVKLVGCANCLTEAVQS